LLIIKNVICNPQSAIRNPQSAIRNPQSAIANADSVRVTVGVVNSATLFSKAVALKNECKRI